MLLYNKHKYRYGTEIEKYNEEKYVRVLMMPRCKYSGTSENSLQYTSKKREEE